MTESNESGELSAEQQDTTNLLERLLGRAISDRYVDFCRLASGAFELRVARPLAFHSLRELDGILTRSLNASLEIRPLEESIDPQHIKAREELSRLEFDDAAIDKAVGALKPRTSKANQIRQITERLGLAPDGDVAKAWISVSKEAGRAHEHSFHESLSIDEDFRKKFQQPFEMVIRAVALSLQRCYSLLMRRVEELAAMSDKGEAADLFRAEVPGAMPLQWHFFQRLQTPDWLPLLVKRKLIGPPLPGLTGTGINAGRYGEWPAGSYLRRMAESEDSTVRGRVAMAVRNVASSKHPDVRRSGMDIIAAFPAAEAACLAEVAVGWQIYAEALSPLGNVLAFAPPGRCGRAGKVTALGWLSHLLHDSGPLGPKLDDLHIDYVHEIGLIAVTSNDRKEYLQNRLGDYLVALYLNEYLDLQSGGLLDLFLIKAPGKVRQHVMWALGTNLKKPIIDFPELQRTRALAFWDSRLAAGEVATERADFKEELGSIGQWCENHQIEPSWLFDRLLRMFRSGFVPAPADYVVEWLGNVRETHVDCAVEVLEVLLTNPNGDRWVYVGQDQSIRALLTAGQSHGTTATVNRVFELVSFLASSGQPEYLDLVRPAQPCS